MAALGRVDGAVWRTAWAVTFFTWLAMATLAFPFSARGQVPAPQEQPDSVAPAQGDPTLIALEGQLARGFSLTTARETARRLSTEAEADSPELILISARAHAEARSWSAVRRLLRDRDWLDRQGDGEGRLLLARARLALGDPEGAIADYEQAGVERLSTADRVDYARALARAGRPDDGARQYRAAAAGDREISDWLLLSSVQAWAEAGAPDSALAAAASLSRESPVWRDSTFSELARAFFIAGDSTRALTFVDSLSRRARSRLAGEWLVPYYAGRGDTARAVREAESAIRYRGVGPEAGEGRVGGQARVGPEAGEFLLSQDSTVETLRRVAEIEVREGRPERGALLLEEALEEAADGDRAEVALDRAQALFAARQYSAVGRFLDPWIDSMSGDASLVTDPKVAQRMRFLAGRALYRRGLRDDARVLWSVVASDPQAPDGPYAAFLLADIQHDRGRLLEARAGYEETVARFPRSSHAGTALIRLGMIGMVEQRPEDDPEPAHAVERGDVFEVLAHFCGIGGRRGRVGHRSRQETTTGP